MSFCRTVVVELGTILDSSDGQASAWTRALRNGGYDVRFADVRERIGMGCDELLQDLSGLLPGSAAARRIHADRRHLFQSLHLANVTVHPGTRNLIARLHREGYALLLTSSCECDEAGIDELLDHADLRHEFDEVFTVPVGAHSKPSPDAILSALERACTPPNQGLVLGDTPYDVAAARAAGVVCIALESGGWPADALSGAAVVYRDALDLLSKFESSPLSRSAFVDRGVQRPLANMSALSL